MFNLKQTALLQIQKNKKERRKNMGIKNFLEKIQINNTIKALLEKHGENHKKRIITGVNQVADLWREKDGSPNEFNNFCLTHFISNVNDLNLLFNRFQDNLEQLSGHFHELKMFLSAPMQVERHKKIPADFLFSEYNPGAHVLDDFFKTKIAFLALLNFKIDTLEERLTEGESWSRRQWAESRLVEYFSERIPASVNQEIAKVYTKVDNYINEYNFFVDNIVVNGRQIFPDVSKLICHWGLRDHIKALYAEPNSLEAQKTLYETMNRVVCQTIPQRVINNPNGKWNPFTDTGKPEPNTRYEYLLNLFRAIKISDPYYRQNKTLIDRRFNKSREIPEATVEKWLIEILSSPVAKKIGQFISKRLGRPLEPFDIWFNQFVPKQEMKKLDLLVQKHYPELEALQNSLANILVKLNFSCPVARRISKKIIIDPGRSAGHASSAQRREGNHHLRIRFLRENENFVPNYSTFNTFMHEFGHGVEMFFSTHWMDNNLLQGVPNTAFTEALAFIFQNKDLEILGVKNDNKDLKALNNLKIFWTAFEIGGVALVDMKIWRWMYKNPNAKPEELKNATVEIAKNVWNKFYAPVFGIKNQPILAIYSHIIGRMLYTPDYFLGSLIQHQIQEYLEDKNLGAEIQKMYMLGNLVPDFWMKHAVGSPISTQPIIKSAEKALEILK